MPTVQATLSDNGYVYAGSETGSGNVGSAYSNTYVAVDPGEFPTGAGPINDPAAAHYPAGPLQASGSLEYH